MKCAKEKKKENTLAGGNIALQIYFLLHSLLFS